MSNDFKKFLQSFLENLISKVAFTIVDNWGNEVAITEKEKNLTMKKIQERIPQIAEKVIVELEKIRIYSSDDLEKNKSLIEKLIANAIRENLSERKSKHKK